MDAFALDCNSQEKADRETCGKGQIILGPLCAENLKEALEAYCPALEASGKQEALKQTRACAFCLS